jgi:hypothetical protein
MSSRDAGAIVGGVVSLLLTVVVLYYIWVWPIRAGVRVAKSKGRSPHWMWFGVHPLGAWIALAVLRTARPLKMCPRCSEALPMHARCCPYCSHEFDLSVPIGSSGSLVDHAALAADREARVALEESWIMAGADPLDRVAATMREFLLRWNMEIQSDQATPDGIVITATQGSQVATRMLGAWVLAPRLLPKAIRIEIQKVDGRFRVKASARETFGVGFLDRRTKQKYDDYLRQWLGALRDTFPDTPRGVRQQPEHAV